MALLTWRWRGEGPTLYLDFEATLLEEFTRAADITVFPVENGAVLTDHYQPQPRAITLQAHVTNTPVDFRVELESMRNAARQPPGVKRPMALTIPPKQQAQTQPVTGLPGQRIIRGNLERGSRAIPRFATILQFDGQITKVVDAFTMLDLLMERRQLVNVLLFGDLEFQDMMIVNLRAPQEALDKLTMTIDLVEVRFADTETTEATSAPEKPIESSHQKERDTGNRDGQTVEPSTKESARVLSSGTFQSIDTSALQPSVIGR